MRANAKVAATALGLACGLASASGCTASGVLGPDPEALDDAAIADDASPEARQDSATGSSGHPDAGHGFDATFDPDAPEKDTGLDGAASCEAVNTCANAFDMGSVSGDTTSPTKTETGFASKWLMVKVTEDDSSPIGRQLRFGATLTSPPGANFDLFVYMDPNGSPTALACNTLAGQSTSTTDPDSVPLAWGEGSIANRADDTRIVSIEVRYVSGTCDPSSKWTLEIQGN